MVTGGPSTTFAKYSGHIEWCYWGICYLSDLSQEQRYVPGGKSQCNCYRNTTVAKTGMPCNNGLCCGCSWDCSALGGVVPKVGPHPSLKRAKVHFSEIVSTLEANLNLSTLKTLGVSSSSKTHRKVSHTSHSTSKHPASSPKRTPKLSGDRGKISSHEP